MNWIRLLKNIPLRLNEERSEQLAYQRHRDAYLWLYVSSDVGFCCPRHWLVVGLWRFHVFNRAGRAEILAFLKLAQGCSKLLDLGASAGIFSAIFAVSRPQSEIVSVEPDQLSFDLLKETIEANRKPGTTWRGERVVVGSVSGPVKFLSSGFGGSVTVGNKEGEEIRGETLVDMCERLDFWPDIIKIDVESFEDETLIASLDWLRKIRPRIVLELHWGLLVARGKDPAEFVKRMAAAGLSPAGGGDLLATARRHLDRDDIARLILEWRS